MRVSDRANRETWRRTYEAGRKVGPLFLRASGSYLSGHDLDLMSRHLAGGLWDLPGPATLCIRE